MSRPRRRAWTHAEELELDRLALKQLEESPWANQKLDAERLAGMVRHYGIRSKQRREGQRRTRGHRRAEFEDAS